MTQLISSSHKVMVQKGVQSDQADAGYEVTMDWTADAAFRGDAYTVNASANSTAAALANPTAAPTAATASTGGTMVPGNYVIAYTWTNADGETLKSPELTFTIPAGTNTNTLTITVPALPAGASATNVYVSAVGGAAGSETKQGSTATTSYAMTAPPVAGGALPTANTTAPVILYLKNTDTVRNLVVNVIEGVSSIADKMLMRLGDTGTPGGGTAITPVNRNATSANTAPVTANFGAAITGLTPGKVADRLYLAANVPAEMSDPIVLPPGGVLTLVAATGGGNYDFDVHFVMN